MTDWHLIKDMDNDVSVPKEVERLVYRLTFKQMEQLRRAGRAWVRDGGRVVHLRTEPPREPTDEELFAFAREIADLNILEDKT